MKIRLLLILMSIGLIGQSVVSAQSGKISLTVPVDQVSMGETVAVTIAVQDVAGVYGGSIELSYDPQILEVLQPENQPVTPGDFFANQPGFPLKNVADVTTGSIEYAMTLRQPAQPVTGSGSLGTLQFRALQDGAVQINVVAASLLSPRFEVVNGQTIARSVDEVPVEVQGLTLNIGAGGQTVVQQTPVPAVTEVQSQAVAAVPQSAPVASVPQSAPLYVQPAPPLSPVVMAGLAFFVVGLLLFTFSLGTYVRLRRQYAWHEQR